MQNGSSKLVRVPEGTHQRLKFQSAVSNVPVSRLVDAAVREYLGRIGQPTTAQAR